MPLILVTGATGTVGSRTVERLVSSPGVVVRAAVHRRAAALRVPGVEHVRIEFRDLESLQAAMAGVDAVFLVTPSGPDEAELAVQAVDAAASVGVRRLVRLSGFCAERPHDVQFMRQHLDVERAIAVSGIPFTFVRPQRYMENFITDHVPGPDGAIRLPWGSAGVSLIATDDVADFAARVLTSDGHLGWCYTITGPAPITVAQVAAFISAATGRRVTYLDTAEAVTRSAMLARGLPPRVVDPMLALFASCKAGRHAGVTTTFSEMTGRAPRSFSDFARQHADAWWSADPRVGAQQSNR
ncbi:MAG TPA: NmrA family NAD(P)-binding protein [Acidimicrobiales bacterium]